MLPSVPCRAGHTIKAMTIMYKQLKMCGGRDGR